MLKIVDDEKKMKSIQACVRMLIPNEGQVV